MWTTHDFTKTTPQHGVRVIDVSQEGHVVFLEGSAPGVEAGDVVLFQDPAFGVRFWDVDDLGDHRESEKACYQVRTIEYNPDGISWIACAEHHPRVKVEALPPEM